MLCSVTIQNTRILSIKSFLFTQLTDNYQFKPKLATVSKGVELDNSLKGIHTHSIFHVSVYQPLHRVSSGKRLWSPVTSCS